MESESSSLDNYFQAVKASKGSHFQFKSEKEWQSSNIPVTSKFTLNLKTLNEDMSTIPFYERQQLPKELFSEEELAAMDREAQMYFDQRTRSKSEPKTAPHRVEKDNRDISSAPDSAAEVRSDMKSLQIKESNKKTDDLEDWLDSVLDD